MPLLPRRVNSCLEPIKKPVLAARRDARVFAGTGWTLVRAQATMGEGAGKIREGIGFFTRGVRLLGSDVSSAGRLFYRAGAGASLRPREVRPD